MRIGLVSDVHLSVAALPFPEANADVLVLAGDIARPEKAIEWARQTRIPALYVAGNHEFYGSDLATTYERLARLSEETNVHLLEQSEWHHHDVRFLGCTLWSDYRLFDSENARSQGLSDATRFLRDFTAIKVAPDFDEAFSPALSQLLFAQSVAWLDRCFAQPHAGPTVVITHFAPTLQSISPKFAGSPINACFVSDLTERIERWQPSLWFHGHTHDSFDYRVGRTRIICNARGYAREGHAENDRFDPMLTVELT